MTQFGRQFGKAEIKAIQEMNERVVDSIFSVEKQQKEDTASPLDGKPRSKAERQAFAQATLADPLALGAFHDDMAQQEGLTPERPISREWVAMVIKMTKELREQ